MRISPNLTVKNCLRIGYNGCGNFLELFAFFNRTSSA